MNKEYEDLIRSTRVSPQTREVLLARAKPDEPSYEPRTLSAEELRCLRSVLNRVIPQNTQTGDAYIDLAARLGQQLADGKGDGWRYATLPSDMEAFRIGLGLIDQFASKLSSQSFDRLTSEARDGILGAIASGRLHSERLDLKRWFEDLCAGATQLYVAHPQTLARMGYSGIADDKNGFVQLGIGQAESWEPKAQ